MNTSEVLNRAADLIEERGWTTGSSGWEHEKGGPLCLEGGILAAIGGSFENGDHYRCPAYKAVSAYLADRTGKAPFAWNDSIGSERMMAWIHSDDFRYQDLECVEAEVREWAKNEVISVLRATAVVEAAKENADVREQASA